MVGAQLFCAQIALASAHGLLEPVVPTFLPSRARQRKNSLRMCCAVFAKLITLLCWATAWLYSPCVPVASSTCAGNGAKAQTLFLLQMYKDSVLLGDRLVVRPLHAGGFQHLRQYMSSWILSLGNVALHSNCEVQRRCYVQPLCAGDCQHLQWHT